MFIDKKDQLISEASVHRLLRENGLLTSPGIIVMKAGGKFKERLQPALADRLHVLEYHRLRQVLLVDDPQ